MSDKRNLSVRSVERAIQILKTFSADEPELGVGEIGRRVRLPKSTVFRLLYTLETCGFVGQDSETNLYHLGVELIPLANSVFVYSNLCQIARPHLRKLVRTLEETASLSVLLDKAVINLEQVEFSGRLIVRAGGAGNRIPFHATSVGKAIAAYLPKDQLDALLESTHLALTSATITDEEDIQRELTRVRGQNYATGFEEVEVGLHAIAAPIYNHVGDVIASISVSGPAYRLTRGRIQEIAPQVIHTADQISREMGFAEEK